MTSNLTFSFGSCPVGTDMAPITIEAQIHFRNGSCIQGDGACIPSDNWVCTNNLRL
jgi:hypothetical protein